MTDPNTPDSTGENTPTPNEPSYPPATPPAPPAAPQVPGYGAPAAPVPPAPSYGAPTPPAPATPPAPPAPAPGYGAPAAPTPPAPGGYDAPAAPTYDAPAAPPSAYPAPAQGGFPPPPGGGFPPAPGGFPPAPQPGAYAGAQGYVSPPDVGQAFSWGWAKFKENAGALIVSHLLWGIVIGVVAIGGFALAGGLAGTSELATTEAGATASATLGLGGIIIVSILVMLIAFIAQIALTNGYLVIADGRKAAIGDFFKFRNVGQGIILSLLVGVASGLLSFTGVGALAVSFFAVFAMYFVVDRGLSAIDAIKASVDLAMKNAGQTILLVLLVAVAAGVGAAVCGIGALVTVPLGYLAVTYLYRRFSGGQVAA